jgi:hypothetical protein
MTRYASAARIDGLFDQARAAWTVQALVESAGGKLRKSGNELRGACILCGAGHSNQSVFQVRGERWKCWSCEAHGDVIDLAAALRGEPPAVAARWLLGKDYTPRPAQAAAPEPPKGPTVSARVAEELWRQAQPFAGTLGETYLRRRGISPEVLALAAPRLRFHPAAKHHWDERGGAWVKAPAIVLQVETPAGPTGGVHVTYLDRATAGKAGLDPAKRMWGPQTDGEGRAGGAWLIGPEESWLARDRQVSETTLSVATLSLRAGLPVRAVAALSLGALQGGWKRDEEGCIDPFKVQPDPGRPPFTWPAPPDGPWPEVLIAVDRDMSEIRVKARTGRGRICSFALGAEARATICGRLAVAGWKAAGAVRARAIAPAPNSDFNDELRRQLARERDQ